jgi:choline kinase
MTTTHAVILTAGEGNRLKPLTNTIPKCLAEVNGETILGNALQALSANGVEHVGIVVGHLSSLMREKVGPHAYGMTIDFIENDVFKSTNSMYSLYLGLRSVRQATWVIEGDVFFEGKILRLPVSRTISWLVDSSRKDLDGAYLRSNRLGRAISLEIIRDLSLLEANHHKSIGILHLSPGGADDLRTWLHQGVEAGQTNVYYDLIMAEHLMDTFVELVDVSGAKWFEIDTLNDLDNARRLFA